MGHLACCSRRRSAASFASRSGLTGCSDTATPSDWRLRGQGSTGECVHCRTILEGERVHLLGSGVGTIPLPFVRRAPVSALTLQPPDLPGVILIHPGLLAIDSAGGDQPTAYDGGHGQRRSPRQSAETEPCRVRSGHQDQESSASCAAARAASCTCCGVSLAALIADMTAAVSIDVPPVDRAVTAADNAVNCDCMAVSMV